MHTSGACMAAPHSSAAAPQAFREQLVSGEIDFATLASQESHCGSASRGGDLGYFGWGAGAGGVADVDVVSWLMDACLCVLTLLRCCC
jgi:hypothetical protein